MQRIRLSFANMRRFVKLQEFSQPTFPPINVGDHWLPCLSRQRSSDLCTKAVQLLRLLFRREGAFLSLLPRLWGCCRSKRGCLSPGRYAFAP